MNVDNITFEKRKINDLKPYPNSPRVHTQAQFKKLVVLVRKYGCLIPVLIGSDGVIVDGHLYWKVLKFLGYEDVLTVTVSGRNPQEIRAIRLALNRLPEDTGWDQNRLKIEFEELLELSFDLSLTGFDQVEIDMTLSIDDTSSGIVEDAPAAPDPESEATTKPGDIWILGENRVLCADCLDRKAVARLFGDDLADMIFTDPPWNLRIPGIVSGKGRTKHGNFAQASGEMSREQFIEFLREFLEQAIAHLKDGAILYICIDWRHLLELQTAVEAVGLTPMNICVWTKTNAGMGLFYRSQHEFVCVFKWGDAPHINTFELGNKGRSRSNVWRYPGMNVLGAERDALLALHPTVKPVAMVADAIKDVSHRNHVVFDPFLGSGTTVIAAEETGRRCFGIEIDPRYVDTAIGRWQAATGQQAIHASTGKVFDDHGQAVLEPEDSPRLLPPPSAASSDHEEV